MFNQVRQSFLGLILLIDRTFKLMYTLNILFQVLEHNSESRSDIPLRGAGSQC
jgi:hypothetical protein